MALFICFAIRNVILALFMGVVIGGPVSDREKVAHEELAYIVDSTASPVATIIPFNVYGWFAILFTLLFALGKFPLMDHVLTPLLMALLAADLAFVLYTSIAFMIV